MDAGDGRNSIYTEPQAGGLIDFQSLGFIFLIVLVLSSLFEVGLLVFAYINADKVECNLLWCTFTSGDTIEIKNSYSNYTQSITSTSQCFINGVETNCSEVDNYKSKFDKFLP
jgi:hypothetical protein